MIDDKARAKKKNGEGSCGTKNIKGALYRSKRDEIPKEYAVLKPEEI